VSAFEDAVIQRIKQLEREVERLQRWERPTGGGVTDHGALTGLADNDHPQYLLTTGKAADSDKLDGNDSSYFSPTTHNHDHNTLINFVANKHIDHSGVSITAGAGLTGGGNLTATRTIALSHLGFQSLTDPNADRVLFWDDSAGALKWLMLGTGLTITDTTIKPSQPQFYPLASPLTSTAWNGQARSTTAKTLIDLSTEFGVPAGVKAVYVQVAIRDSASATTDAWIVLGADNTAGKGINFGCGGLANDMWARPAAIVPCNTDGDIYYQINASGTSTFDVYLFIWGYWL
jgi:hypothetical protein